MEPLGLEEKGLPDENVHERVRRIAHLLEEMYGDPPVRRDDPLDALVATVLSQNTSDANSHRAFANLKARFASWGDVRRASVEEVAEAIRCGGLAHIKAARIKRMLDRIQADDGRESLEFLANWDTDRAKRYLASLEGVGPKTIACVLLFGYGRPVFPVDTHVLRIAKRLGLVGQRVGADTAHDMMARMVPPGLAYALHVNLITHGRRRCRPQYPRCEGCLLAPDCTFRRETTLT